METSEVNQRRIKTKNLLSILNIFARDK